MEKGFSSETWSEELPYLLNEVLYVKTVVKNSGVFPVNRWVDTHVNVVTDPLNEWVVSSGKLGGYCWMELGLGRAMRSDSCIHAEMAKLGMFLNSIWEETVLGVQSWRKDVECSPGAPSKGHEVHSRKHHQIHAHFSLGSVEIAFETEGNRRFGYCLTYCFVHHLKRWP